jgi:1-phosphatidylinositol-3-phosphate 5-kinase
MDILFNQPRVLLLGTSLEIFSLKDECQNQSFEDVIKNEKKKIKKLVDLITNLKPKIILIEKSINKIALDLLIQQHIAVVYMVKRKILDKISQDFKIKIIDKLEIL